MKIGLNAICLSERPSGAKQRFIGIYSELFKRMPDADFTVYQAKDCDLSKCFPPSKNVTFIKTPIPSYGRMRKFLAGLGYWRNAFKRRQFDLFEGYHLPFMASPTGKNILTIHDIRGVKPESAFAEQFIFRKTLSSSFAKADCVITVSNAMRSEILEFHPGLDVSVIYNGITMGNFYGINHTALIETRQKFSLPENFLLTIGHFEKRKNYPRMIEALSDINSRGLKLNLVMVGNESGELQTIKKQIESAGLAENVIILNGISDHEVHCLYRMADLFVFPSFYEGFGIPVLEAMAADCPMVLSDIPVFREITQNQSVYFKHDDVSEMISAIESVLQSETERQRIISYGRSRIEEFSFIKIASELESLYRKVVIE